MRKLIWLLALILPVVLTACGSNDEFEGRFIAPDGLTSYQFLPEGQVNINKGGEDIGTAQYEYDSGDQTITLSGNTDLPSETFAVSDEGHLQADDITLTRGVDYGMLADSTWIGHTGPYSFSLTFTETDAGMATFSELVTYYDDDKTYMSQTDDSITRLSGNMLFVDMTQYEVSDVSQQQFKLTIANSSMVFEKHPKDTKIEYREGYQSIDDDE